MPWRKATPCTSCQGSTRQDRTTVSLCVIARKLEASGIMQTVKFLQLTRGKSKSMTIERSSPQARDYRARKHTQPTACRSALNDYETTWFASVRFLGWQGASGLLFGPGSTSSKVSSTDCTQPTPTPRETRSLDHSASLAGRFVQPSIVGVPRVARPRGC